MLNTPKPAIRIFVWLVMLLPSFVQAQLYNAFQPMAFTPAKGDTLFYRLLSPEQVAPGNKYPIVLFLHGSGERGHDNEAQLAHVMPRFVSRDIRAQYPAYVIAPQCPGNQQWTAWYRNKKGEFEYQDKPVPHIQQNMMAVIDDLIANHNGDPNRVYVVGLSMGGIGTWDMLNNFPDRFAAGVPICGVGIPASAAKIKNIPIWAFHGADDNVVPPAGSRDMIKALRMVGGNPVYTEFEGVKHNSWEFAFDANPFIYDWLFSQHK